MKLNALNNKLVVIRSVLASITALALVACGGGGSGPAGTVPGINSGQGVPTTSSQSPKVTLTLTDVNGLPANNMTSAKPLSVSATVVDERGQPVSNTLVAFNVDASLAVLSPSSGTVATDASGIARVKITPASMSAAGGGLLKAVAMVGDKTVLQQAVFSVGASKITLKLVTPTTNTMVLKAYDSTVVTMDVYSDGVLLTDPVSLSITSVCGSIGKATVPTAVTTINGRAQFVYRDQGCAQNDTLIASMAGTDASITTNFQIGSPNIASIEVSSVVPADRSIVIKGAGASGRTETAIIKFKVLDQFGNPLANQLVTFNTISTKTVTLNKTSDTTDASGQVVTVVNSGTEPTAVRVQATLPNGLSTISDTISVTTGIPTQAAFSLSAKSYNIEGFNYDNTQTDVNILLADQFGNPIADGTAVVFQTDSGAIGSSDRGGCTTVNGGCTAVFRSQNPRYASDATAPQKRAGLASITVSASDNSNVPLTGKLAIFLSGSFASNITRILEDGSSYSVNGSIALTNNGCSSMPVRLRLSDSRLNPLPSGTNLSSGALDNLDVSDIFPSVVPSISPQFVGGIVTGDQGSVHFIPVKPSAGVCVVGGPNRTTGSAVIQATTPNGNVTPLVITMTFPSA